MNKILLSLTRVTTGVQSVVAHIVQYIATCLHFNVKHLGKYAIDIN